MNDMGMEGREKKEKLLKRTKGAARFFHIDCQALRVGGVTRNQDCPSATRWSHLENASRWWWWGGERKVKIKDRLKKKCKGSKRSV